MPQRQNGRTCPAFTLVELLTVIGLKLDQLDKVATGINGSSPYKGKTFAGYLHNHSAHTSANVAGAVNPDSFVVISAGKDGLYGTDDDVNISRRAADNGLTEPRCPEFGERSPNRRPAMPRTNHSEYSAFTILELLVVIGIIALLTAITVPALSRLIDSQKQHNTLAYMHILGNAISIFEQKSPLGGARTYSGKLPPDYFLWRAVGPVSRGYVFEWWNPGIHPDCDPNNNGIWDPGEKVFLDQEDPNDEGTGRYNPNVLVNDFPTVAVKDGLQRLHRGVWTDEPEPTQNPSIRENYRSIESLYLYLTRLCPECQQLIKALPASIVTNNDVCDDGPCPEKIVFGILPGTLPDTKADMVNGKQVDVMEIRDAWGKPMRYQAEPSRYVIDPVTQHAQPTGWRWELRSAGPDGVFAKDLSFEPNNHSGMFLPSDKSGDDVILSSQ